MAEEKTACTEEELEEQFREDPMFALQIVHSEFRENVYAYITSLGWWKSTDEIDDVYQDTMCRLVHRVQQPDFDRTIPKPMRLVQDIAKKATYDFMRRRKRRSMASIDAIVDQIAEDMKDTTVRLEWMMVKPDWPKFQKALDKSIEKLPPKQKAAAKAFMHVYEDIRKNDYSALASKIKEMTGEDVTTAQASENWREAKRKIADDLGRVGLNLLGEE